MATMATLTNGKAIAKTMPSIINPAALNDETLATKSASVPHDAISRRIWLGAIARLHANP